MNAELILERLMNRLLPLIFCIFLAACSTTNAPRVQIASDNLELPGDDEIVHPENQHQLVHPVEDVDIPLPSNEMEFSFDTNLWERIRSQFSFPIPQNKRIQRQQDWYVKHPRYMARVTKRAEPFLHLIVEEIEKHDMPLELALLPIVESAFDPFAYSHGRASGIWQFVPGTARRFGLKQTWWYDGRRDVAEATKAAIKYLAYLHKFFDGNWLHALASYNSGEGRVMRAIKKNKKLGKPTDFWSLSLPKETRAYVPKLLALVDMLQQAESLEVPWHPILDRPVVNVVDTGSQIDLAFAAELAGLTVNELHALNPGYNRWATDPNGPHKLLLPIDKVEEFIVALNDVPDRKRLNWVRHTIKNGDNLLLIAKRYHTTVDVIKDVNEIRGNVIRAGDHILVPVALKSLDKYGMSQEQRIASIQSRKRGSYKLDYKVKKGDTMWDISRAHNVNVRSLAKWNGMAPTDPLMPGKTLAIWVNKISTKQSDNAVMRSLTYTVRNGDSLARIAGKFNVSVSDLVRWNQLNPKRYLQPKQKLKVFVDVTKT
jgi:membrane-bound lytic murein transglycosylase D